MINRIKHAIVGLFLIGNFSLAFAAPPKVTRFTLNNGIRVISLYVEDSTDVVIFSYLRVFHKSLILSKDGFDVSYISGG